MFPSETHRSLNVGEVTQPGDELYTYLTGERSPAEPGLLVLDDNEKACCIRPLSGDRPAMVDLLRFAELFRDIGDRAYEIENAVASDTQLLRSYTGKLLKAPVDDGCLPYCLVCGGPRLPFYFESDQKDAEAFAAELAENHAVLDDVQVDDDGNPFIPHGPIVHARGCWVDEYMKRLYVIDSVLRGFAQAYPELNRMAMEQVHGKWKS